MKVSTLCTCCLKRKSCPTELSRVKSPVSLLHAVFNPYCLTRAPVRLEEDVTVNSTTENPASTSVDSLKKQRETSLKATRGGPPNRPTNPFFGVGPITDMTADEHERRTWRFEFERWLEENYRKTDARGQDAGPITPGEMNRGMHRGYPADKVVLDMMRSVHSYFGLPESNRMAVGLGGGHTGFSVCVMHLMSTQGHVFVDTPKPETSDADEGGFFRQSWGAQLLELHHFAAEGDPARVHFADDEGRIPSADEFEEMGITLFVGVGHETTGATTYSEQDVRHLLEWLARDPQNHHALIDATSLLGAMPWEDELVKAVTEKCCLFMPLQKAIGGVAGYFLASFTPEALEQVEKTFDNRGWAIPRQMKLAVPKNSDKPLSGEKTTALGPFYDPEQDKMLGGVINTFSTLAFAETTFALKKMEEKVGSVHDMNAASVRNRQRVGAWVAEHDLFELGVKSKEHRGAAVTLLKVDDPDIDDADTHARIIAKAKQLLSYQGLTHPNGDFEKGLDVARYINAFPGTPGDFRAWIGGARPESDITGLLDNLEYAYHRAKVVVLEEILAEEGVTFEAETKSDAVNKISDTDELRHCAERMAAFAAALASTADPERQAELLEHYGTQFQSDVERYDALVEKAGFQE